MPFRHNPRPSISFWKPDYDDFDQANERLLVYTNWGDRIILAWSTDDRSTGGHIIAHEAIPENIASHFGDTLKPYEYAPGKMMQPLLFVYQEENGTLKIELAHPLFEGSFDTGGAVSRIHPVRPGQRRHSVTVGGYTRPIRQRRPTRVA